MKLKSPVRVKIRNYQSISELDFDVSGFTCITGGSNIGKSAIIRAISSAILNHPVGNAVRKGEQFCSVDISSQDWGFKWEKNEKGVNRIWLRDRDTPLDKLGQKQVPEVAAMGFGSIHIGDDEIQPWLAPQFQYKGSGPLFLLDQSGPRVTDFISEVSRLTVLQDAIILAARGKKQMSDQVRIKSEQMETIRKNLEKVQAVDTLEKLHLELKEQAESIETYQEKILIGESIFSKIQESTQRIYVLGQASKISVPEKDCDSFIENLRLVNKYWARLEISAKKVIAVKDVMSLKIPESPDKEMEFFRHVQKFISIPQLQKSVSALKKLDSMKVPAEKFDDEIQKLGTGVRLSDKIQSFSQSLDLIKENMPDLDPVPDLSKLKTGIILYQKIELLQNEIVDLEKTINSTEENLRLVNEDISTIPACPTCNRPVSVTYKHSHAKQQTKHPS